MGVDLFIPTAKRVSRVLLVVVVEQVKLDVSTDHANSLLDSKIASDWFV